MVLADALERGNESLGDQWIFFLHGVPVYGVGSYTIFDFLHFLARLNKPSDLMIFGVCALRWAGTVNGYFFSTLLMVWIPMETLNFQSILQATNPALGAQFSPNLHAWLQKWGRKHNRTGVIPNVYRSNDGDLWIGQLFEGDGSIIGCRLISVLCNGKREETANHISVRGLVLQADFWDRYMAVGRCAIDEDHSVGFVDDSTRWTQQGDSRRCLWCGHHTQKLHRWTQSVDRSEWQSV